MPIVQPAPIKMTELLQQTLYMDIEALTPCLVESKENGEETEESYVPTNFDEMVSDFCSNVMNNGYVILGKTISISQDKIFVVIQYMEKPSQTNIEAVKGIVTGM